MQTTSMLYCTWSVAKSIVTDDRISVTSAGSKGDLWVPVTKAREGCVQLALGTTGTGKLRRGQDSLSLTSVSAHVPSFTLAIFTPRKNGLFRGGLIEKVFGRRWPTLGDVHDL